MGTVPRRLAAALKRDLALRRAVETGTGWGVGSGILADLFDDVVTIELSEELHEYARAALADRPQVRLVHGESSAALRDVHDPATPTFYFLDAHWSAGKTAGRDAECPLLPELAGLRAIHPASAIVIDDARLFSGPPPPPHDPAQWPTLDEVTAELGRMNPAFRVRVVDDQIVAVPPQGAAALAAWERTARRRQRVARARWWGNRLRRLPRGLRRRLRERLAAR